MKRSIPDLCRSGARRVADWRRARRADCPFPRFPTIVGTPDLLKFPDNLNMGEAAGVATNSKGDIFVYTRTGNPTITLGTSRAVSHGGSRLFQFDRTGKFVREIGQGAYGLLQAQQVRVDPQDNVWIVDQMSTQVIKFDPNGRVQMILSRKPEAMRVPALPLTPLADRRSGRSDAAGTACRSWRRAAADEAAEPAGARRTACGWRRRRRPAAAAAAALAWSGRRRRKLPASDRCGVGSRRQHLRGGRLRQRARREVRTERQVHQVVGIARHEPGQFNIVHGIAIDAPGKRVRRRRRQQARAGLRRQRHIQDAMR